MLEDDSNPSSFNCCKKFKTPNKNTATKKTPPYQSTFICLIDEICDDETCDGEHWEARDHLSWNEQAGQGEAQAQAQVQVQAQAQAQAQVQIQIVIYTELVLLLEREREYECDVCDCYCPCHRYCCHLLPHADHWVDH
jgi:hypothetical protein